MNYKYFLVIHFTIAEHRWKKTQIIHYNTVYVFSVEHYAVNREFELITAIVSSVIVSLTTNRADSWLHRSTKTLSQETMASSGRPKHQLYTSGFRSLHYTSGFLSLQYTSGFLSLFYSLCFRFPLSFTMSGLKAPTY